MEFGANSSTATVSLQTLDDHRDVPNGSLNVEVVPPDAALGPIPHLDTPGSRRPKASTTVTDDDTAQELELNFGKEGVNDADVE